MEHSPEQAKNFTIACFDVYYYEDYAKAASLVFTLKPQQKIISCYRENIKPINEYIPGEFYKRELPCILAVLGKMRERINLAIVDGYATLAHGKKGLGGHLFAALGGEVPVIGVAKTFFMGCTDYAEVYRGKSKKPLFVSSVGIPLDCAVKLVRGLAGENRIPDVLKKVDRLSRAP